MKNMGVDIFKSKEQQDFFDEQGYLKLEKPLLDESKINELVDFYYELGIEFKADYGFEISMENPNKQFVKLMMEKISSIVLPVLDNYLKDYKFFISSFIIKNKDQTGLVMPHQDWSFVNNEEKHYSFTCWIPLTDITLQNGCMGIIKGSQNVYDYLRATPSYHIFNPIGKHLQLLTNYMELFPMKRGEVLFFNNKAIHGSMPNTTIDKRLAIGIVITNKDAEFVHYYLDPKDSNYLLKYSVDESFYLKYDNKILSRLYEMGMVIEDYPCVDRIKYEYPVYSLEQLHKIFRDKKNNYHHDLYRNNEPDRGKKSGFLQRINNFLRLNGFL